MQYAYDQRGLRTATTEAVGTPQQRTTNNTYDTAANLLSATDPLGDVTRYQYDPVNRPTATIEAFGTSAQRTTSKQYDLAGNVVATTDARGTVTRFAYDLRDREIQKIEAYGTALQRTTASSYDAVGNLATDQEKGGHRTFCLHRQPRRGVICNHATFSSFSARRLLLSRPQSRQRAAHRVPQGCRLRFVRPGAGRGRAADAHSPAGLVPDAQPFSSRRLADQRRRPQSLYDVADDRARAPLPSALPFGHIWQGRFKAFPIQEDEHLLTVLRYAERNPLRANLVAKAEDWHWSSAAKPRAGMPELDAGPVRRPARWRAFVNEPQTEAEVRRMRESIQRGWPFGDSPWMLRTAEELGIESSPNPRGRPRKEAGEQSGDQGAGLFE